MMHGGRDLGVAVTAVSRPCFTSVAPWVLYIVLCVGSQPPAMIHCTSIHVYDCPAHNVVRVATSCRSDCRRCQHELQQHGAALWLQRQACGTAASTEL